MAGFSRFVLARRPHRSPYSLLFRRTSVRLFHDFFRQYAFDIEETNRLFFFLSSVAETSHTLFRQGNGKTAIKKSFCPCLEIGNCGRIKPQGENTNPSRPFPLFPALSRSFPPFPALSRPFQAELSLPPSFKKRKAVRLSPSRKEADKL